MDYPEYVKIGEKKYKINTDFRIAIKCNNIANDYNIGDYERALAIIYTLFGEEGLIDYDHYEKLLELAQKYLACGKEIDINQNKEEPNMDFEQDMDYIEASFMSDYNIDLSNIKMHWWKFFNLLNGLSNSEMGNCCVLNRVRNLRDFDLKTIKDSKQREKIRKAKEMIALKKKSKEQYSQKEEENIKDFLNMLRKE